MHLRASRVALPAERASRNGPAAAADGRFETVAAEVAERARRNEEIASIRTAIAALNGAVLATYGGLNGAVARYAALDVGELEEVISMTSWSYNAV